MMAVKIKHICFVEPAANLSQLETSLSAPAKQTGKQLQLHIYESRKEQCK